MAFVLTTSSVILCPHGGVVMHVPMTMTTYRINGELAMLLNDRYIVTGCPFTIPYGMAIMPSPCLEVTWMMGSNMMFIKGTPVLTNISSAICLSAMNIPQGPAIITSYQTRFMEPNELTRIEE